jgi:hypothetical protein
MYFKRKILSLAKKRTLQLEKRTLVKGSVLGKIRGLDVD